MANCKGGGETLSNGNCTNPGPDGISVQCVGSWAADKHHYLAHYIGATRAVRAKFLPPDGKDGSAFIDLFAGPGMVRVRETGEIREGSPLIALHHRESPFSRLVFCDSNADNVESLEARTASEGHRVKVVLGDSNKIIAQLASEIPEHGLNIALVDPFALSSLKFNTLQRLAKFARMDLIVHFPTGDMKRNWLNEKTKALLTDALGTSSWESDSSSIKDVGRLVDIFKSQLCSLGYGSKSVRSEPIKNSKGVVLYYLVYASKNPRGDKIWESITKKKPSGQREMW